MNAVNLVVVLPI